MIATTSTNGGIAPESETRSTWFHGPPNIVTVSGTTAQTTSRMVRPDGSGLPLGLVALTWVCGGSHRDLLPEAFSDANIRTMSVTAVDDAVGFRLALTLR